jgi:hypothetical protein
MDCRVLSAGVLATLELPARRFQAELEWGRSVRVIDLAVDGVRGTLTPTASSSAERSPDPRGSDVPGPGRSKEGVYALPGTPPAIVLSESIESDLISLCGTEMFY